MISSRGEVSTGFDHMWLGQRQNCQLVHIMARRTFPMVAIELAFR